MTSLLVLGGTGWLGGEIARRALATGWVVTCLARGVSGEFPPGVTVVCADRSEPGAYRDVIGREWDLVVELSWQPALVRGALAELAALAGRWVYVSSISVYASHAEPGQDESGAVLEPFPGDVATAESYGEAKVRCELLSREAVRDRLTVVRPGLIVGPGDPSDRFGYWVGRFALAEDDVRDGGAVLVPEAAGRTAQVIDVRDLAAFVVRDVSGVDVGTEVVNAVDDPVPLGKMLNLAAAAAGFGGETVTMSDEELMAAGVTPWAGPRSLPLWFPVPEVLGEDLSAFLNHAGERFRMLGGECRPLRQTMTDVATDERARGLNRERRAGLTRLEELTLLNGHHPRR